MILSKMKMGKKIKSVMCQLSKLAVILSHSIYCARDEPSSVNAGTFYSASKMKHNF